LNFGILEKMSNLKSLGITWSKVDYNVDGEAALAFLIIELETIANNIKILHNENSISDDYFNGMSGFIVTLMQWATTLVRLHQNNEIRAIKVQNINIKNKITMYNSLKNIYNASNLSIR